MKILFYLIAVTVVSLSISYAVGIYYAWQLTSKFVIGDFKGYRKSWIERLVDAFELFDKF